MTESGGSLVLLRLGVCQKTLGSEPEPDACPSKSSSSGLHLKPLRGCTERLITAGALQLVEFDFRLLSNMDEIK